jgi:putative protease
MKTELLLPVGNYDMCLAAIHHGADAVYMGVPYFNARGRTTDFSFEELKEMIDLCHLYGVRVNLAFNVVIFENEFPKVIELLQKILPMGPDAFIVQDLGLAQLIRKMAPHQRIHASTQMTVTNADAIKLLEDLKIDRFVLGRENSISEMKLIREQTDKELEVFVHGALCVAYSGQCFTSESIGGRSANRGQCAQSCRLEYELWVDDRKQDMGNKKYLVSPKDLLGIEEVPQLKELGINSFKVEGRLKTPEYVAAAALNYREVIDGASLNLEARKISLSTTYSRGFFSGWLNGVDHQQLVDGTYSAHRGLEIGRVKEVRKKTIIISSSFELVAGMGLLFVGKKEAGSKIFAVNKNKNLWEIELVSKNLKLEPNELVYVNSNAPAERQLQKVWLNKDQQKRIPLNFVVTGRLNHPLVVKAVDPESREVQAQSSSNLCESISKSLDETFVKNELSALGASVYSVAKIQFDLAPGLFVHQRELKEIRRNLIEKMNQARTKREVELHSFNFDSSVSPSNSGPGIYLLLRTKLQVEGLIEAIRNNYFLDTVDALKGVILDFEFGKDYASSVEAIRSVGLSPIIATTRILKPKEYHNLKMIARCRPDKILARNLGAIEFLKQETNIQLMGDFSLNVSNSISAQYLLDKGLDTVNLSYDLNQQQLMALISKTDASKVEVTLHQYMPEFHMEHCVFAAFLSQGHSFRDCGKPCEKHEVKLKDPYGNWHHLKADHECRNTFFKAIPQSASFLLIELLKMGVSNFRIEALNETPKELNHKILIYLKLIKGLISSQEAVSALSLVESYGLGAGQLDKKDNYKDRKKDHAL